MILFATSEIYPFSKSGGLGDVAGILPLALKDLGRDVAVVTPLYGRLNPTAYPLRLLKENCPVGYPWPDVTADVYLADYQGVPVYFVDRPEYFDRKQFYCTYHGEYFDNCERFIFFSRAVMAWARWMDPKPTVLHCNDWHTSLIPAYLFETRQEDSFWSGVASVQTIHNLAFQGQYSARLFWESGLSPSAWHMDGAEYHGSFNMLKTGIAYADKVTTVSPSYAREIMTQEFGYGLEGLLARRAEDVEGILNGVDYSIWDPRADPFLRAHYGPFELSGKQICKEDLLERTGLHTRYATRPVLGFIGRMRWQKGVDLILDILPELLEMDLALVFLGEGDLEMETHLTNLSEQYPGQLAVIIGYTEELSHQIMAGSDIFLMPSRYEPCGLTQLYGLRYGALPVTSNVGGLRDTVVSWPDPEGTGFKFDRFEPEDFAAAVRTAVNLWEDPRGWEAMRERAMLRDFSWEQSAVEYDKLYRGLEGS